jgi:hypothetical protein
MSNDEDEKRRERSRILTPMEPHILGETAPAGTSARPVQPAEETLADMVRKLTGDDEKP